jgi:hypothetical protein
MARARFGRRICLLGRSLGLAAAALAVTVFVSAPHPAAAAGGDDAAVAQELVGEVQKTAATRPEVTRAIASALAQVAQALERGRRMRMAGDETHARTADVLAREWAETARDVARAVSTESLAAKLRTEAVESQAQLERTRARVEEGIAHVGRLQTEVDKAEAAGTTRTAVEHHDGANASPPRTPGTRAQARKPVAASADAGANVESTP